MIAVTPQNLHVFFTITDTILYNFYMLPFSNFTFGLNLGFFYGFLCFAQTTRQINVFIFVNSSTYTHTHNTYLKRESRRKSN